jgi:hypothetical protein
METPRSSSNGSTAVKTPTLTPDMIVWDKKTSPVLSAVRGDKKEFLKLFASSAGDQKGGSPVSTRSPHLTLKSLRRGSVTSRAQRRPKPTGDFSDMKALLESPKEESAEKKEDEVSKMMPEDDDDDLLQCLDEFEATQRPKSDEWDDEFECDLDEETTQQMLELCAEVEKSYQTKH